MRWRRFFFPLPLPFFLSGRSPVSSCLYPAFSIIFSFTIHSRTDSILNLKLIYLIFCLATPLHIHDLLFFWGELNSSEAGVDVCCNWFLLVAGSVQGYYCWGWILAAVKMVRLSLCSCASFFFLFFCVEVVGLIWCKLWG